LGHGWTATWGEGWEVGELFRAYSTKKEHSLYLPPNLQYNLTKLKNGNYPPAALAAYYSFNDMMSNGYSQSAVNAAIEKLRSKEYGYSLSELSLQTLEDIIKAGYPYTDPDPENHAMSLSKQFEVTKMEIMALKERGDMIQVRKLEAGPFIQDKLKKALENVKTAGFTAKRLAEQKFTAKQLEEAGYNATQLKGAGFTATQLKEAGFPYGLVGL
jgi:intracellular multiplication protein IcmE